MIFIHPETGLEIMIIEKMEHIDYLTAGGETRRLASKMSLETEAGQNCIAMPHVEKDGPMEVDVLTANGPVRLVRKDRGY